MAVAPLDLGRILRGLRRRADLSQRELAERAHVPTSSIGRIESGDTPSPGFRTIERLVAATGGSIRISGPPERPAEYPCPPEPPHEDLGDAAGRRYPAHLDVRRVTEAKDWWGAWWANWYNLPRHRWPREAPEHTFDLSRRTRDHKRRRRVGAAQVARLTIAPQHPPGQPDNTRLHVATDDAGLVVGWVGGYIRPRYIDGEREFLLCGIEVAPAWRRLGLGTRLLAALRTDLAADGIPRARVLIDELGLPLRFFHAGGFQLAPERLPTWLTMPVRRSDHPRESQAQIR